MLSKGESLIGGITPLIYTVLQVDKEIIRNEILWLLCRICKCIYYFTKGSFILEVLKNRFCKCKNSKSMVRWPLKICTVLCPKCICVYGDTLCYKVTVCHISVQYICNVKYLPILIKGKLYLVQEFFARSTCLSDSVPELPLIFTLFYGLRDQGLVYVVNSVTQKVEVVGQLQLMYGMFVRSDVRLAGFI